LFGGGGVDDPSLEIEVVDAEVAPEVTTEPLVVEVGAEVEPRGGGVVPDELDDVDKTTWGAGTGGEGDAKRGPPVVTGAEVEDDAAALVVLVEVAVEPVVGVDDPLDEVDDEAGAPVLEVELLDDVVVVPVA